MQADIDLVTGAFGFSGSYVVKELLAQGRHVIAADLAPTLENQKRRDLLTRTGLQLDHPRLEIVPFDLLDVSAIASLFRRPIRRVFHTASLYDYSAKWELLKRINIDGTQNLLHAAVSANLERFVHWSTCGVFGKPYTAAARGRRNLPFSEDSSSPKNCLPDQAGPTGTHLVNIYSITKWEQEKMVWSACRKHNLPVTVIRPAPMYGPGSDYGHGGIILFIARGLLPFIPASSRRCITTSVHVEDVARFACFIADRKDAIGEDYNVVDNSVISYNEFLQSIALLLGRRIHEIPLVPMPFVRLIGRSVAHLLAWLALIPGFPKSRIAEVQSAAYLGSSYWISNRKSLQTGFVYKYPDVREGLKDTVQWMGSFGWL
jgi:dihydroflavonol-4-reductase